MITQPKPIKKQQSFRRQPSQRMKLKKMKIESVNHQKQIEQQQQRQLLNNDQSVGKYGNGKKVTKSTNKNNINSKHNSNNTDPYHSKVKKHSKHPQPSPQSVPPHQDLPQLQRSNPSHNSSIHTNQSISTVNIDNPVSMRLQKAMRAKGRYMDLGALIEGMGGDGSTGTNEGTPTAIINSHQSKSFQALAYKPNVYYLTIQNSINTQASPSSPSTIQSRLSAVTKGIIIIDNIDHLVEASLESKGDKLVI